MALQSLGKVTITSAGTPKRCTDNQSDKTARVPAHSFLIEAITGNGGSVYIGSSTMNTTTLDGVYAILPPPTANIFPSFTSVVTYAPAAFNMADIWLDVSNSGDSVLVSIVRA